MEVFSRLHHTEHSVFGVLYSIMHPKTLSSIRSDQRIFDVFNTSFGLYMEY